MKPTFPLFYWVLLFITFSASAQLPDFVLNVTATDETCTGNGLLVFSTEGTLPGSTVRYSVYQQPNLEDPIYSGPANSYATAAGTYNVVAVETLNGETNIQRRENIVIQNAIIVPLAFNIALSTSSCDGANVLTVNVIAGTGVQFGLESDAYTVPPQSSNVFSGVPNGVYIVRAYDSCGQNLPQTVTVQANSTPPTISNPIFNDEISGDCNSLSITNTFSYPAGTVIEYPITIIYTVHPGDGSPDIVSVPRTYNSGLPSTLTFSHTFDIVIGRTDTYDITITNGCGTTFVKRGVAIAVPLEVSASKVPLPCGQYYLQVDTRHFTQPYTITFTGIVPEGFNPRQFNSAHPRFDIRTAIYGGLDQPVPFGTYNIEVTDACLRTARTSITIIDELPVPDARGTNAGCFSDFGRITISIPSRTISSAVIVGFTSTNGTPFTQPLPYNVSSFINNGNLSVGNLPIGTYRLRVTDDCGSTYPLIEVVIPPFEIREFEGSSKADCTPGMGGITVSSLNGKLTEIFIVDAPEGFNDNVLPLDVSQFIASSGILYMNNFMPGTYKFSGTDECGIEKDVEVTVITYQPGNEPLYTLHTNCNSFDITLSDSDTTSTTPTYWLQVENPEAAGQWLQPDTGAVYVEGTRPNGDTAVQLQNNEINVNLSYSGIFRILKTFQSIGNGVAVQNCILPLGDPFEYNDSVTIDNIYHLSCSNDPGDVYIDATGTAPLTYFILERNGEPFPIDNGTNNVFSNLTPGIYRFAVRNPCGQDRQLTVDISTLPDIVTAARPDDIVVCIAPGDSESQEVDLTIRTTQILNGQSPEAFTVTYYTNRADAVAGRNPLPVPYTTTANPQTIYARVINNFINVCPRVVNFQVWVSENPLLTLEEQQFICSNSGGLVITADEGYDQYSWTSTERFTQLTASSIEVYGEGEYSVTVSNLYGRQLQACSTTATVTVRESGLPQNVTIEVSDWTEDENVITVNVTDPDLYEYSLDNINYQSSPVFTGLEAGLYKVYIRDRAYCATSPYDVVVLNYPKFFTPNGDGENETWHIKYSSREPGMIIYIYDRYGKLIKGFDAQSAGWDGTLNGSQLPATDYWFVVNRQDGRVFKGHFSLVR
jgi:gliding motility-associated-like protein